MNDISSMNSALASTGGATTNPGKKSDSSSWFEAMAEAWGQALDQQAARIETLGTEVASAGDDTPSTITQLTAESLRMGFLANSSHTSLTSISGGLEAVARKQ